MKAFYVKFKALIIFAWILLMALCIAVAGAFRRGKRSERGKEAKRAEDNAMGKLRAARKRGDGTAIKRDSLRRAGRINKGR